MAATLTTTASDMELGADALTGVGQITAFTFSGTWVAGETFAVNLTVPLTSSTVLIGAGDVVGVSPFFVLNYGKKINFVSGKKWYFSAVNLPTDFNGIYSAGNGNVNISNNYSTPEDLMALSPYQGKMAVFGKNTTQIWSIASNPDDYRLEQVLANTGTIAKASVAPLGELDVFYLDETGIRTLRSKDSTLNAFVDDVGSPVDLLVQAKIVEATTVERAAACGIVDPSTGRYWLFIKDTIYVLSQFRSSKITAFSTYVPSYQTTDVMRFYHADIGGILRVSMVNDASKAFYEVVYGAGTNVNIPPGCYVFLIDSGDGSTLWSTAIQDGVKFRGTVSATALLTTFTSNQTTFVPQKFLTRNKRLFARTSTGLVAYGGATGAVYDNAVASARTPWLDADSSEKSKVEDGIDASMIGAWYVYASADYISESYTEVMSAQSTPTYMGGKVPFSSVGSHFSFWAVSNAASRAVFSAISLNFKA